MPLEPTFEFHLSRVARERCRFEDMLFSQSGLLVLGDPVAARRLSAALTRARSGEPVASAADIYAIGLLDEAMHLAAGHFRKTCDPRAWLDALAWFDARLGHEAFEATLLRFTEDFPPLVVHRGELSAGAWLAGETGAVPHRAVALEELMMLWLGNSNPACAPYRELFDDRVLANDTAYSRVTALLREYFETRPRFGPAASNLVDFLRAPMDAAPDSLFAQLDFVREQWAWLLGDLLTRLLVALDVLREESRWFESREHARRMAAQRHFGGDSSEGAVPRYGADASDVEYERFSADEEWMPRCVLVAKSTHVWLDQLAREYRRPVSRLDEVPEEELARMAAFGITGLWLIGLWERSRASQRIKQLCGNPDAAASAYSLHDYAIAADLGGEEAWRVLRDRAAAHGVRLASDMVPNHMGLDSRWVIEHPEWFLSLPYSPYPAYSFNGPDLSGDERVELKVDDHYFDRSDAAVVFRRHDRGSGDTRFLYHGNDGTSFPWNDTAQIDYLNPAAREQVMQTILAVARRFPIIRFDAAMTLARRHVQRLWFPEPGSGGAIPSRAEHGMSAEAFARAMPQEFWREVVDRVAVEAPGTLLLAEAFWLMEGYFVRTLGMHRVYNSAFMNMMRDEQNANYRTVIKNTIEFDPEILQRYVNFMNNPDERTAVDQFGRGEKYFGVCTLLATLPGLPMFGHGQVEGLEEKYGMEYRRAQRVETPDAGLVAEHWRRITPLLQRRGLFSDALNFRLYDCWLANGGVNEDVYAYSNRHGDERAVVIYHNRYADAHGWIRSSVAFAEKRADGSRPLRQETLGESLGLDAARAPWMRCRDVVTGLEHLLDTHDLASRGLRVELGAYGSRVLIDWREVHDDGRPWGELCRALEGRGIESLDDRMLEHELAGVHRAFAATLEPEPQSAPSAARSETARGEFELRVRVFIDRARDFARGPSGAPAGVPPPREWSGDMAKNVLAAGEAFVALGALPVLAAARPWHGDAEAASVLPLGVAGTPASASAPATDRRRTLALAWIASRALAATVGGTPERSFDTLRLRRGVHDILARTHRGVADEDLWRGAALVRSLLLTADTWAPGVKRAPALPWQDDPDAAWLIGSNESGGVRWFRQEDHARFAWWSALPALLGRAADRPDAPAAIAIEAWVAERLAEAKATAWRFDAFAATPAGNAPLAGTKPVISAAAPAAPLSAAD